MGGIGVWFKSWIGILSGICILCSMFLGAIVWHYTTFATDEEVTNVKEYSEQIITQLSQKTLEGFESVNKTNMQMQKSIKRFDLKDSHKQLMEQKYRILKLLEIDPDKQELKIDLDECRSRIDMIETELKDLRLSNI